MGFTTSSAGFAGAILGEASEGAVGAPSERNPGGRHRRGPSRPPPMRSSGPLRSEALVHALVVEPVAALDALLGAGDVLLFQLLEVGHARHDVMALRGMAGLRLLQPPLRLLLVLGQLLQRVPRRIHARVGGEERDEDELVAELAQDRKSVV